MNQKEKAKPAYAALMKFYPLTLENLDSESWLPVPDYEDYQVSNYGRIKRFYKNGKPKIIKPNLNVGYLRVCLCKDNKPKNFSVHRLVALAFIPNPENKPQINHIDGCKLNNYVRNLEWATAQENTQHAHSNGLVNVPQGEEQVQAKLTNEQVEYIRNNPDRLNLEQLAAKFGVDRRTIGKIQLGKEYKNAGGIIRKSQKSPVPEEVRAQIRAEYKKGKHGYGSVALGRKYGITSSTVLKIVKES